VQQLTQLVFDSSPELTRQLASNSQAPLKLTAQVKHTTDHMVATSRALQGWQLSTTCKQ